MLGALFMITGSIFLLFFARNIVMLMAGEILCGMPWGAFQTLTTTYAAEVAPIILRPYLTTYVNMCCKYVFLTIQPNSNLMAGVAGQLISTGVLRGLLGRTDQWAWRIPVSVILHTGSRPS